MTRHAAAWTAAALAATALIFAGYAAGILPHVTSSHLFTALWVLWILAFAVVEGVAVVNDAQGDTLSEHFRLWFRTDTKLGRSIWLWFSGGFVVWFVVPHIAMGIA